MPERIRVVDVVRGGARELSPEEPILRGSYDLFRPAGPVRMQANGLAEWVAGESVHSCRVVSATLGSARVGERVLLQLDATNAGQWWLCEVEAVDGVQGND